MTNTDAMTTRTMMVANPPTMLSTLWCFLTLQKRFSGKMLKELMKDIRVVCELMIVNPTLIQTLRIQLKFKRLILCQLSQGKIGTKSINKKLTTNPCLCTLDIDFSVLDFYILTNNFPD